MLAGQPPFTGPTAQAIIARHPLDEAPSLVIVRGTIPEEVEDVVIQAMAKLPADRFATAGDMAEVLRKIMTTGVRPARVTRAAGRRRTHEAVGASAEGAQEAEHHHRGRRGAGCSRPARGPACTSWGRARRRRAASGRTRIRTISPSCTSRISPDGKLKALAAGLTESLIDELSDGQTAQGDLAKRCRSVQGQERRAGQHLSAR